MLPNDEEMILLPKGLKINGKTVVLEDISFVPHENNTQTIK